MRLAVPLCTEGKAICEEGEGAFLGHVTTDAPQRGIGLLSGTETFVQTGRACVILLAPKLWAVRSHGFGLGVVKCEEGS